MDSSALVMMIWKELRKDESVSLGSLPRQLLKNNILPLIPSSIKCIRCHFTSNGHAIQITTVEKFEFTDCKAYWIHAYLGQIYFFKNVIKVKENGNLKDDLELVDEIPNMSRMPIKELYKKRYILKTLELAEKLKDLGDLDSLSAHYLEIDSIIEITTITETITAISISSLSEYRKMMKK